MDDIRIAQKYMRKHQDAKKRKLEFKLNFTSFKNICKAKRCYYTGIPLTDGDPTVFSHRTIDRVDATKGYVTGNVVASSLVANRIKGVIESNNNGWSIEMVRLIVKKLNQ